MNRPIANEDEIFRIALAIPDAEPRQAYLDQACGDDGELRQRLDAILIASQDSSSFLHGRPPGLDATIASPLTESSGDTIGRYKLLQQIGEGGFGIVFMAEQTEPVRRKVALKIVKPGMDTKEVVARFEAERQALAIMDHPNIAKVLDAGTTDSGRPYFVMELVKGVTITDYADTNNLSTDERLKLFASVCRAVNHAHQKGVIHRDIKPSNVLVTLHDGKPVAKVIDFGVAKAMSQPLTERTMFTKYGQVIGTPQYMSPEQAELSGLDVDTRSDIYSLGVILYELLTGRTPFLMEAIRAAGFDEMRRMIREDEPPRPSNAIQTLDADTATAVASHRSSKPETLSRLFRGELDWIVMKALEKDRSRRYDSANSLAEDVDRYLNNEAVNATPPSLRYRFWKSYQRNRLGYLSSMAIATSLLIALGVSVFGWIQSNRQREMLLLSQQQTERERERAETERQKAVEKERQAIREADRAESLAKKLAEEAETSETTLTLLLDVLDKSRTDPETGAAYTLNDALEELAGKSLAQAEESVERSPVADLSPRIATQLHLGLGNAYITSGRRDLAARHFQRAFESCKRIANPDPLLTAKCLRLLGYESYSRDLIEQAIAIERKQNAPDSLVSSLTRAGELYLEQGDAELARTYLSEACELFASRDPVIDLGDIPYMPMARTHRALGQHAEENRYEQLAIKTALQHFGKSPSDWERRGVQLRDQGQQIEAEYALLVAASLSETHKENTKLLDALFYLGLDYRRDRLLNRSEAFLRKAYQAAKRNEDDFRILNSAHHLGLTYLEQGKLSEAGAILRDALVGALQSENTRKRPNNC